MEGCAWDPLTLRYSRKVASPYDPFMLLRLKSMRRNAAKFRPVLGLMEKYAPNAETAAKAARIQKEFELTFGGLTLKERALRWLVRGTALVENFRYQHFGVVMRQPPTLKREYYPDATAANSLDKPSTAESAA